MKILPIITNNKKAPSLYGEHQTAPNFYGKKVLAKPIIDTCCFTHSDKTLEPKFLQNLLKLDNENISVLQKYTKIKDEMLRAMGYKHPEKLKLELGQPGKNLNASYEVSQGKICVNESNCSVSRIISTFRHELEHLDQFVKIYKTMGEKTFLDALASIAKRQNPEAKININFNKKF